MSQDQSIAESLVEHSGARRNVAPGAFIMTKPLPDDRWRAEDVGTGLAADGDTETAAERMLYALLRERGDTP